MKKIEVLKSIKNMNIKNKVNNLNRKALYKISYNYEDEKLNNLIYRGNLKSYDGHIIYLSHFYRNYLRFIILACTGNKFSNYHIIDKFKPIKSIRYDKLAHISFIPFKKEDLPLYINEKTRFFDIFLKNYL